jgi:hypothetical protein
MINPLRRLLYELFVLPILNGAQTTIELTSDALHVRPFRTKRDRPRKRYLLRWEHDTLRERRST